MGISETIIAAIIGALATMATAIVQLVRNRAPSDGRPKPKKSRMRSMLATVALMIGCIVGGYAWSSLRAVRAKDDLKANSPSSSPPSLHGRIPSPRTAPRMTAWRHRAPRSPRAMARPGRPSRWLTFRPARSAPNPMKSGPSPARIAWRSRSRCAPPFLPRRMPPTCACWLECRRVNRRGWNATPAHRLSAACVSPPLRRNIRSAPISVRCASTWRTGAWTTRWRFASSWNTRSVAPRRASSPRPLPQPTACRPFSGARAPQRKTAPKRRRPTKFKSLSNYAFFGI